MRSAGELNTSPIPFHSLPSRSWLTDIVAKQVHVSRHALVQHLQAKYDAAFGKPTTTMVCCFQILDWNNAGRQVYVHVSPRCTFANIFSLGAY